MAFALIQWFHIRWLGTWADNWSWVNQSEHKGGSIRNWKFNNYYFNISKFASRMSCQFFFLIRQSELFFLSQIMSIEDAEGMDETTEGIEYQRVSDINWKALISVVFNQMLTKTLIFFLQKIDKLLSGSLTQEDEDAVLQELEEMTKVCTLYLLLSLFSH